MRRSGAGAARRSGFRGIGSVAPPTTPAISGTVTIGGTLTITPGTGGVDPTHFAEYLDGIASGRTVAANGRNAVSYTIVEGDMLSPTSITFKAIGGGGASAASNALGYAGLAASISSLSMLRDASGITASGTAASDWDDSGGGGFDGLDATVAGPEIIYCKGRAALDFTGSQVLWAHTDGVPGTVDDLFGATSWHLLAALRANVVTSTDADIRDAECVINDPAVTAIGVGFQKSGADTFFTAGFVNGSMKQPDNDAARNKVTQGEWFLADVFYDHATTTLSVRVDDNTPITRDTLGAMSPSRAGRVVVCRNWQNEKAHGAIAVMAMKKGAVMTASESADARAYIKNTFLTEIEVQPSASSLWGNVEADTNKIGPDLRFSSEATAVIDTDAPWVRMCIGIESGFGMVPANQREHQFMVGVGASPGIVWSQHVLVPPPLVTPSGLYGSAIYGRYFYAPVLIPGSGMRRVFVRSPARLSTGTGGYLTPQSLMFPAGSSVTVVPEPTNGCIIGTDSIDDHSEEGSWGWYYLDGVLIDAGGYDTARAASLARITRWATGKTAGTVVLFGQHTQSLRARFAETNIVTDLGRQAQKEVEDIKAALPGWKVIGVSVLPLPAASVPLVTQTAVSAAEVAGYIAGGADGTMDGQTEFWSHTVGVGGGICLDTVHPYLAGMAAAQSALSAKVVAVGGSGKPLLIPLAAMMVAPCRESPSDETYVPVSARSLLPLFLQNTW